ncbi:MAG: hypothetical protein AAF715_04175 [Myxococcota bacterium]
MRRRSGQFPLALQAASEPLALRVLEHLTEHHRAGTATDRHALAASCEVSVASLNAVVDALDHEGFVDGHELRLTLAGFALGLHRRTEALVCGPPVAA